MGQNMYDYSHPCDHDEIKDILSVRKDDESKEGAKSFFIRLKCTLTSKGRSVNLKSATYKVNIESYAKTWEAKSNVDRIREFESFQLERGLNDMALQFLRIK